MKYAQLSEPAKERAREWFKTTEAECWGSDRAPNYYEDMATCLKFLGITVSQTTRTRRGAGAADDISWWEWDFEWSGFWSQGDGLVFQGTWAAADVDMTGLAGHAPQDEVLKRIAIAMTAIMLAYPTAHGKITTVSHGPGLPSMRVEETGVDDEDDIPMPLEHERQLKVQVLAAAHWCYRQLEANYEADTSDEAAVDGIEANGYDFDREGRRTPRKTTRCRNKLSPEASRGR